MACNIQPNNEPMELSADRSAAKHWAALSGAHRALPEDLTADVVVKG